MQFGYDYSPSNQPDTDWVSKDGSVFLHSDSDGFVSGLIDNQGDKKEILVSFTGFSEMYIHEVTEDDDFDPKQISEYTEIWEVQFISERKFRAIVKQTTYFTTGEEIVFYQQ